MNGGQARVLRELFLFAIGNLVLAKQGFSNYSSSILTVNSCQVSSELVQIQCRDKGISKIKKQLSCGGTVAIEGAQLPYHTHYMDLGVSMKFFLACALVKLGSSSADGFITQSARSLRHWRRGSSARHGPVRGA